MYINGNQTEQTITYFPDTITTVTPDQTVCGNTIATLAVLGGTSCL